ncbi:hypothetical protein [Pectobacterium parmentieri]|uniref:hypothetical protein n=1 Tax=Pectobacterium parmentieri TaxID=1905730 RepID=UPI00047303EC|nr:hypothetical protein [Pectobacterium parmentieri]PWD63903.1 hypothetical protein DF211_10845 [Pectobacterium parmentieri]
MRLTQEVYKNITRYRQADFVHTGIEYLHENFEPLITYRNIPEYNLEQAINQSYEWVDEQGRPSQLLAMRTVCARLCFGSFFMHDLHYSDLHSIMREQFAADELTDDDPVYHYIMKYRSDWLVDWFKENRKLSWDLIISQRLAPLHSPNGQNNQQLLDKLFASEKRESIQGNEHWEAVSHSLNKAASQSLPVAAGEHVALLLAIAQYYDGYQCFNDPLRPRWYNCQSGENVQAIIYRLQDSFN